MNKSEITKFFTENGRKGGKATWANKSKTQRSVEMSRRRKLGIQKKENEKKLKESLECPREQHTDLAY